MDTAETDPVPDLSSEKLGFLDFLVDGRERGGFKTDDALAAVLPLMEQVLAIHLEGKVAIYRLLTGMSGLKMRKQKRENQLH